MNSIQISIEANEEQQEILISELSELGAEGFEQTESSLIAYFNENTFKSYEVNDVIRSYSHHLITLEEKNWNEVWESNFQPVVVNNFCAIRAEFHEPIKHVQHEIIITPKMSFGTGHHATTHMMIEQMQSMDLKGKNVFDFGTGTGILSILAEKLGAEKIIAIDVEEWSIRNAEENRLRNQCSRIELQLSSKIPEYKFDMILANINRNVIVGYLPQLLNSLEKGGQLLMSGLLSSDETEILNTCFQLNLRLVRKSERNNWISLLLIK